MMWERKFALEKSKLFSVKCFRLIQFFLKEDFDFNYYIKEDSEIEQIRCNKSAANLVIHQTQLHGRSLVSLEIFTNVHT